MAIKTKEKTTAEKLSLEESLLDELLLERYELYKKAQDFSVDQFTAQGVANGLKKINTQIKKAQHKVNDIKRHELGYSWDAIWKEEKWRRTSPT